MTLTPYGEFQRGATTQRWALTFVDDFDGVDFEFFDGGFRFSLNVNLSHGVLSLVID